MAGDGAGIPGDPLLLALAALLLLSLVAVVLLALLLARRPPDLAAALQEGLARQSAALEQAVRGLRGEFAAQSRQDRQELGGTLTRFGGGINRQMAAIASGQNQTI